MITFSKTNTNKQLLPLKFQFQLTFTSAIQKSQARQNQKRNFPAEKPLFNRKLSKTTHFEEFIKFFNINK